MALDKAGKVDAIGIETQTGEVVLSIIDSWEWNDPHPHLLALQAKLKAYLDFVEEGQLISTYPAAVGREVVIDVVTRHPLHPAGAQLLARASEACADLRIKIRTRHLPGGVPTDAQP